MIDIKEEQRKFEAHIKSLHQKTFDILKGKKYKDLLASQKKILKDRLAHKGKITDPFYWNDRHTAALWMGWMMKVKSEEVE